MEYFYNVPKIIDELSLFQIGSRIFAALALGLIAAYSYRVSHNNRSYSLLTMISGIICAIIVTMVLMAIDSNLPRAFGLFAALSLIRFRMPVKDIRDIVYLFFCLAIGISCGAGAIVVAATSTLFIVAIICIVYFYFTSFRKRERYSISIDFNGDTNSADKIKAALVENSSNVELLELSNGTSQNSRALFSLELFGKDKMSELMTLTKSIPGVAQVTIVSVVKENEFETLGSM